MTPEQAAEKAQLIEDKAWIDAKVEVLRALILGPTYPGRPSFEREMMSLQHHWMASVSSAMHDRLQAWPQ